MPAKRETKAEPAQTLPPAGRVLSAQWDDRSTFTVLETAEILGLSSWAAWQAVNNGNIPTVRIGRKSSFRGTASSGCSAHELGPLPPSTDKLSDRPIFIVHLRQERGDDPVRQLRAFLKVALRRFGLRALSVREEGAHE